MQPHWNMKCLKHFKLITLPTHLQPHQNGGQEETQQKAMGTAAPQRHGSIMWKVYPLLSINQNMATTTIQLPTGNMGKAETYRGEKSQNACGTSHFQSRQIIQLHLQSQNVVASPWDLPLCLSCTLWSHRWSIDQVPLHITQPKHFYLHCHPSCLLLNCQIHKQQNIHEVASKCGWDRITPFQTCMLLKDCFYEVLTLKNVNRIECSCKIFFYTVSYPKCLEKNLAIRKIPCNIFHAV